MSERAPRHPEARTMVAFIEGRLAPDELASVAEHLRGCGECRTVVTETARFTREEQRATAAPRRTWWWLAVAAAVAIAAIIAVPLLRWNAARRSPMARLIAAAPREHRTVAARIAGFPWARPQAAARGATPVLDPAEMRLIGAAGEALQTTNDLRVKGVALLLIGRRAEAVAALERAANNSNDARVWSDLAAARYAMAMQDEHAAQLPDALADADRAIQLDPKLPEAHFNRALILEHLEPRGLARDEWKRYLDLEGGSEWAAEARSHLRALESRPSAFDKKFLESAPVDPLVRQFPQEVRTSGEVQLLGEWAAAEASGNQAFASAKLARIGQLARALAAVNHEHLFEDAVTAVERSGGTAREALIEAHRLYDQARRAYAQRIVGTSEPQFRRAAALFRQGESPMADVAAFYAACAAFVSGRSAEARSELLQLQSSIDGNRHHALAAHIHWQLAVVANAEADWGRGAHEANAAAAIFHSLGEEANATFADNIAAVAFEMMGERDLAWSHRIRTLPILDTLNHARLLASLHASAISLASLDDDRAAEALNGLIVDQVRDDPAQFTAVLSDQACFAFGAGDDPAAQHSIAGARAAALRVADPGLRKNVTVQADLADAMLRGEKDPRGAIALLDRAIDFMTAGPLGFRLAEAYLQRGRAFRAVGDLNRAGADYSAALREVGKHQNPERRLSALDIAAKIIEESIDFDLARGDAAGAFSIADQAHALLTIAPSSPRPPASGLQVPAGVAVLEYAVLPRAVVLFCLTRQGLVVKRVEVDRRDLAARVDSLAEKIRQRASINALRSESVAMHRMLVAPVRPQLSGIDEIVIVPDRQLAALPFAALWDESENRYLAEAFTIRFASSASMPASPRNDELSPALVVADPPSSRWPRLPASRDEADKIAALYGAKMLEGDAATRAAFVDMAKQSALIHFAGHANSDVTDSYGAILLAENDHDAGVLGSGEIADLGLPHHPLVVLAACGTLRGSTAHVSGMSSIARSFLLAGARGVVGTLWEIDDDASAVFFSSFHRFLHAGASPARALRDAQREMIHGSDPRMVHPAAWAPVQFVGSD